MKPCAKNLCIAFVMFVMAIFSFSISFCSLRAAIDAVSVLDRRDSLFDAIESGDLVGVSQLLADGVDSNCLSLIENTPLSVAAAAGYLLIVKTLLSYGADPNIVNQIGVSPLYRAACGGHLAIVKELLNIKNIKVNAADNKGITPLLCAAGGGYVEIVRELLKRKDIQVNCLTLGGFSPLDASKDEGVKLLLMQHGAVAFVPVKDKLIAFVDAVNAGNQQALDSIISADCVGLKEKIKINTKKGFLYLLDIKPLCDRVEFIGQDKVKITGIFSARGSGWEMNNFDTYFIFSKQNNEWFLFDTDFAAKLSSSYFGNLFLVLLFFWLIVFFFWIWMLVDCFNRKFNTRGRWFVLLIFFNVFAAIFYFFIIKIKNIQNG